MAWIEAADVEVLLQTDLSTDSNIDPLIAHVQLLAELEVGEQDAPSSQLKAVLAQCVARFWQAGQNARVNPAAMTLDQAGPFSFQAAQPGAAGLGLTDREKEMLRKAAGAVSPMWVQPTYRNDSIETPPVYDDGLGDELDPVDILAGAQLYMTRPDTR